ncbi:AMP-binding protein [Capillimicrobium parvum]|uniref:2-succinylbenzoate--CoA ligase n=1 Tax=Capillimicrobium parvum TaxID=2884022 RepID=A0A9E6XXM2_9ACTN|nr:AMP-binding protein [Capillimicrobium parvum]UGS36258.1 2-succinylbenzoate--CoA ligase [Capillimicrobium parvum]
MLVEAWLERAARTRPDREAVNGLSYAQLRERARAGAGALAARGVAPGDLVGIALAPGTGFVTALHAVWGRGAVAVPVDLRLGADERAHVQRGCRLVVDAPLPIEGDGALFATHDLGAPAAIIHTSGSTGAPKPIELTFGNWLWSALGSGVALGVDPGERWLCPLPLTHVGGLSIVVRSAIYATTAVVLQRWNTDAALEALRDATLVSSVPTTLARLLDAGWREPPRLRTVLLGGAAIAPALLDRARGAGVPVTTTYGMSEACSQITTGGPPLFCTRVDIAPDGEIVVSSPTVSGGGPLHTGDLGEIDERGHLHVTGRKADTIITGGENVAPTEVEAVLAGHPAVAEAAVHGRPDPDWGEAVVATVVLRAAATEDELRAHAAARLAPYKVPKAIAFAEALPRTASGKLLRRAL